MLVYSFGSLVRVVTVVVCFVKPACALAPPHAHWVHRPLSVDVSTAQAVFYSKCITIVHVHGTVISTHGSLLHLKIIDSNIVMVVDSYGCRSGITKDNAYMEAARCLRHLLVHQIQLLDISMGYDVELSDFFDFVDQDIDETST